MIPTDEFNEDEQRWLESGRSRFVFDEHILDTPIKSIDLRPCVIVSEGTPLADAIRQMNDKRIGSTIVTRNGRLAGIFTERDLMRKVILSGKPPENLKVEAVMKANPEWLTPDHPLAYALKLMSDRGFRHVPLVNDGGEPVSMISVRDIVDYLAHFFQDHVLNLPPFPPSIASTREGG